MSFIFNIFHVVLYQPLFNALVFLYDYVPGKDFGVAIILLTIIIRFILYPLSAKAFRAQKMLSELQPKMQKIQEDYKGNKDEISRRLLELYRQEKFNPLSAFFPIFLQLPVLIAIYQVFRKGIDATQLSQLYSFVPNPGLVSHSFIGILDLGEKSLVIAILAGVFQFIQSKQAASLSPQKKGQQKKRDASSMIQTQMLYAFPLFTVFLVAQFPAAIGVYWVVTSLFSIGQQWYLMRKSEIPVL